jgi:cation-transporting ATPase E
VPAGTSRTFAAIVRANVLTRFNAILGTLLVIILVVGPAQDALFGIVLVCNTLIGIIQETRAKRALDKLALVTTPKALVRRDGHDGEVPVADLVEDDLVYLRPGDQAAVDGTVLLTDHLEVDESLLTGEAEAVVKEVGDEILSGSFVVAGGGTMRATKVGDRAYARTIAVEAKAFALVRSELQSGINLILRLVTWAMIPAAALLVTSQLATHNDLEVALRSSVAGVVGMVPEGLVLLTSIAFAVGAIRLARRRVLVQELPAIEVLARVDTVCIDKTGTITEGHLAVADVHPLAELTEADAAQALAELVAGERRPNATLQAIGMWTADVEPGPVTAAVPFSSARKWSAVEGPDGAWVLGAPDILLPADDDHRATVTDLATTGARVVLLARAPGGLHGDALPAPVSPAALVVLEETVREDAAETLDYFANQGVEIKVISGDHPDTVAAVARRVGLANRGTVDARDLPEDPDALAAAVDTGTVFGRVTPHQKRSMVAALRSRGHVVAMTGDGVNDVLALKEADLGVAMAAGSPASRAVAPLVLLDNAFAALPPVVGEGRRVISNVEQVANLFVTKTVYALLLALAVGVLRLPFPFLPRHLTIISSLTIGIPAFFLALAPSEERAHKGFVLRVLRFAGPAGLVAAAATLTAYELARHEPGVTLDEARTLATGVLFSIGLAVLAILARPLTLWRWVLIGSMAAAFVLALTVPPAREFFALDLPDVLVVFAGIGVVAVAWALLEVGWRLSHWLGRKRPPHDARSSSTASPPPSGRQ